MRSLIAWEYGLTALGATAAAWAGFLRLDDALSAGATPLQQGLAAAMFVAAVVALASMVVGARSLGGGFMLRIMAAFMAGVFVANEGGLGQVLAVASLVVLVLAALLIVRRYVASASTRGVSRL